MKTQSKYLSFEQFEKENRCEYRIACDELGYPAFEARYFSPSEWEQVTGRNWITRCREDYEIYKNNS